MQLGSKVLLLTSCMLVGFNYIPQEESPALQVKEEKATYIACEVYQRFPLEGRLLEIHNGLLRSLTTFDRPSRVEAACVLDAERVKRLDNNILTACLAQPKANLEEVVSIKTLEHFIPCFGVGSN